MIQSLKLRSHKQAVRITKVNLHFENTAVVVINPPTLLQTVFGIIKKAKKGYETPILDRE